MPQLFPVERSLDALNSIRRDLAHAAKSLAKERAFTLVCVISLGIGIGAMVALATFSRAISAPARNINGTSPQESPPGSFGRAIVEVRHSSLPVRASCAVMAHLAS